MNFGQIHEQNNKIHKSASAGGSIDLVNMENEYSLRRWESSRPEILQFLMRVEKVFIVNHPTSNAHEETSASFNKKFILDCIKLFTGLIKKQR